MTAPERTLTDEEARMRNLVLTYIPDADRLCRETPPRGYETTSPIATRIWQHEFFAQLDAMRDPRHRAHDAPFEVQLLRAGLLADQAVRAWRAVPKLLALFPDSEETDR